MSCYHPNFMIFRKYDDNVKPYGNWKHSKKEPNTLYKFVPGDVFKSTDYYKATMEANSLFHEEIVSIPCGKCIGCSMDYSKQWATRCYLESLNYRDNYFITLTYDDDHLPRGELGNGTLVVDDMMKFIKDVRNYFLINYDFTGIRYFGAGEYGGTTFRPHYHLLMFNLPLVDLVDEIPFKNEDGSIKLEKKAVNGSVYYWSQLLSDIWNKGNVVVGKLNYRTCAYTARYVVKKARGDDKKMYEKNLGIAPEFVRMSTRPGLGSTYCLNNLQHMFDYDSILVPTGDRVVNNSIPRYFMDLIKRLDSDSYDLIKEEHRRELATTLDNIYHQYNMVYFDYLDVKEKEHINKIKLLRRTL